VPDTQSPWTESLPTSRISEKLCRGGMGVVYKAEDTRLDQIPRKNVALGFELKVNPPHMVRQNSVAS
jgi:hypothetical protein